MTDQEPMSPFAPPKASLDGPPKASKVPQTVGYLVGAIVQIVLGLVFFARALLAGGGIGTLPLVFGLLWLALGIRAVVRYRRSRGVAK
jgi:hypothetical protein